MLVLLLTTDPHVEMLGHMFAGLERTQRDFFWVEHKDGIYHFLSG